MATVNLVLIGLHPGRKIRGLIVTKRLFCIAKKCHGSKLTVAAFKYNKASYSGSLCIKSHFTTSAYSNIKIELHEEAEQKELKNAIEYTNFNKDILLLHTVPRGTFQYGFATPYAGKIEAYLKHNKIKYENRPTLIFAKPMHKLPWITLNGIQTCDSQLIIERLNDELNIDNDTILSNEQKYISHAFRMQLDIFYWIESYRRYHTRDNTVKYYKAILPEFDDVTIGGLVDNLRTNVFKPAVIQQGMGRFDGEYVYKMLERQIDSILGYIDNKQFFHGDKITSIDFSIYGLLSSAYSASDLLFPLEADVDENKIVKGCKLPKEKEVIEYILRVENEVGLK
eukprot:488164_1